MVCADEKQLKPKTKFALDKTKNKINITQVLNKFKLSSANVRNSSQYLSEEVDFLTKGPLD